MHDFETVYPKLLQIQLFESFKSDNAENKRIMKLLYDAIEVKEFKANEIIIKEGDEGDVFYILLEGSVRISRNTMAGDCIALANLSAEQNIFFGETALIGSDERSATVTAHSDCKTFALSSKNFIKLCEKEPLFGYRVTLCIARRMAKTIKKTNSDMSTLYDAFFNEVEGDL